MEIFNFSPWWLTGFTESDGSFIIIIKKSVKSKFNYRFYPTFEITQNNIDKEIIESLHEYLGCGRLVYNRNAVTIVIRKISDIINIIIPHFDKYPVRGSKFISYLIFRKACLSIYNNKHSNIEGFVSIFKLVYFTHTTSIRNLSTYKSIIKEIEYGNVKTKEKVLDLSLVKAEMIDFSIIKQCINKEYVAGIIDGDGSINFGFSKKGVITTNFTITTSIEDYCLMLEIKNFFQCGKIRFVKNKNACVFSVTKLSDLIIYIQPFLEDCKLNTIKNTYIKNTIRSWEILEKEKGIKAKLKVVEKVYNINQKGKNRRINIYNYIELINK